MQDRYCLQMVACDGGCGNSNGGSEAVELWSGSASIAGETITLKDDLKKFKRIIISFIVAGGSQCLFFPAESPVFDLRSWNIPNSVSNPDRNFVLYENRLNAVSNTELMLGDNTAGDSWVELLQQNGTYIKKVSSGVVITKIEGIQH